MARDLLLRGMLAGALAGLLAFGVAWLLGEPQLELALVFEATLQHAGHAMAPEQVSRAVQRGLGLLVACVAVGVALGGMLAVAFGFAYQRVGRINAAALAVLLAGAGFVVVVLVPQLKYPANPPAVGSEATVGLRTVLYFEMILIGLGALLLAGILGHLLLMRMSRLAAFLIATASFIVLVAALQFALPTLNEIPDGFPLDVLWRFRLASLATQFALWAGLGTIFAALARRSLSA